MKTKILIQLSLCLAFVMVSCSNEPLTDSATDSESLLKARNHSSTSIVYPHNGEESGTSTLHRSKNGVTINFKVENLTPGYAYTLWWVIWNNPGNCGVPNACLDTDFGIADQVAVEVLYATGHVIGNSGKGNFSAHLSVGDDSGSINSLFGLPPAGGLQSGNAFGAEVHAVLRSHGPAVPGVVDEQINSYNGGCAVQLGVFTGNIPDEVGECGDILAAIHAPVN
ncbi:MAG: hypothetical protein V7719_12100 [Psychroserpens sp.]|uniref:hypothetical protein n=1 Tax=Psychroserpens sp. TaxID=2020870 RepID=UPI0030013923